MPQFTDLAPSAGLFKGLLVGQTGAGKTGAYCELANAGYNVRVLDFDNGLQIAANYLTAEGAKRFWYETLTDRMASTEGGITWIGEPKAFQTSVRLMAEWRMPERTVTRVGPSGEQTQIKLPSYNLGAVTSWNERDILVIDSTTMQGAAIMRYNLYLGGHQNDTERKLHPFPADWGEAMNRQEMVYEFLYSEAVKCNVIVCAHVRRLGGGGIEGTKQKSEVGGNVIFRDRDTEEGKGMPTALGRQLPGKLGRYFNTMLYFTTDRDGMRWVYTEPVDNVDCKTPCPAKLKSRYLLKDKGFVTVFQTIRGEK